MTLRPANAADYDYCERLYLTESKKIVPPDILDIAAISDSLKQRWDCSQVRIITLDRADVGWIQTSVEDDALFLRQLFVEESFQRRGVGTSVMMLLINEATSSGRAMTLGVVKTNPARRLYERLGFRITHEDDRKFYMRLDEQV